MFPALCPRVFLPLCTLPGAFAANSQGRVLLWTHQRSVLVQHNVHYPVQRRFIFSIYEICSHLVCSNSWHSPVTYASQIEIKSKGKNTWSSALLHSQRSFVTFGWNNRGGFTVLIICHINGQESSVLLRRSKLNINAAESFKNPI